MPGLVHARYPNGRQLDYESMGKNFSLPLSTNLVINSTNQDDYNELIIECTAALSITLTAGLIKDFACIIIPPPAGNVSIVSDGTILLNGATTTITRAAASNITFAVIQRNTNNNSYLVNGS